MFDAQVTMHDCCMTRPSDMVWHRSSGSIHMSIRMSVHIFSHASVHVSVHVSVRVCTHVLAHVCACSFAHMSIHVSTCMSHTCLYTLLYMCRHVSIRIMYIYLCTCLYACLYTCLYALHHSSGCECSRSAHWQGACSPCLHSCLCTCLHTCLYTYACTWLSVAGMLNSSLYAEGMNRCIVNAASCQRTTSDRGLDSLRCAAFDPGERHTHVEAFMYAMCIGLYICMLI